MAASNRGRRHICLALVSLTPSHLILRFLTLVPTCHDQYFGTDVWLVVDKGSIDVLLEDISLPTPGSDYPYVPLQAWSFWLFGSEPGYQFTGLWSVLQIRTQDA